METSFFFGKTLKAQLDKNYASKDTVGVAATSKQAAGEVGQLTPTLLPPTSLEDRRAAAQPATPTTRSHTVGRI